MWPARTYTDLTHTTKISSCLCIILAVSLKVRKNVTQVLNLDRGIFLESGTIFLLCFWNTYMVYCLKLYHLFSNILVCAYKLCFYNWCTLANLATSDRLVMIFLNRFRVSTWLGSRNFDSYSYKRPQFDPLDFNWGVKLSWNKIKFA